MGNGVHLKDLSKLNRNLNKIIMLDDIPKLLLQFDGMDGDQIAEEHKRRIHDLKLNRMHRQQQGFTKFFSLDASASRPSPELDPSLIGDGSIDTPIDFQQKSLTSKDLVGEAPPSDSIHDDSSSGGMMNWLKKRQKDQQEQQMLKMEKWNEVMIRKQEEKKQK